jgi:RNA polymerase sigma factor (sigma-70 family)
LYERHSPAIHRYCRSLLRSTQEAEDVKQEVFVLTISALRRGAAPDAFRPWLYRVAHNACMSHLRIRRPVLVADNGVLVGPAVAAEPVQHHREELRQLLDDIGNLPDVQRGALLLREMDGFSYEQVGEVLGLPLSTVRASIFRARRTLLGLAEARDADCRVIQSELCELADRRGRRGRHITSHLTVCSSCRDFRDGLRRRPTVLGGIAPVFPIAPGGLLLVLKGKLLGGAAAGGGAGTAVATAGGGAGVAKIAAVAASSIALLAGAGVEADRAIEHGRRDAAVTPSHSAVARTAGAAAGAAARATAPRAPAAITLSAPDSIRARGLVSERANDAARGGSSLRVRARVKEAPAKRRTATSPTPRTTAEASAPAAPAAAQQPLAPTTTRATANAQHPATTGRERGVRRGEAAKHGSKSGGGAPGSTRADDRAEHAPPRAGAGNDEASDRPGTPGAGEPSGRPTPGRSEESSGPPAPAPDSGGSSGAPDAPATPGTPAPSPDPAPAPDPAGPPPGDAGAPAVPPVEPPTGSAGTASVTTADLAGVTVLTQP